MEYVFIFYFIKLLPLSYNKQLFNQTLFNKKGFKMNKSAMYLFCVGMLVFNHY